MMLGESTNAEEFVEFLKLVTENLKPEYQKRKPYLVIDNASAHTKSESKQAIADSFIPMNVPPYSCQFNSIEHLWAVLKHNIRKMLFEAP
jgi:transposase